MLPFSFDDSFPHVSYLEFHRIVGEAPIGHEGRMLPGPLQQRREARLVLCPPLVNLLNNRNHM